MLIYAEKITPRLRYAVQCALEDYAGKIELTDDPEYFQKTDAAFRLNYSHQYISNVSCLRITPADILENSDFQRLKVATGETDLLPVLFPNSSDTGFDVFSALFFTLTRYEEYWRFEPDEMGRYLPEYSILSQMNVLHRPIADEWRIHLETKLKQKFPSIPFQRRRSRFYSTIDIDSAYAYLHKGAYRTFGGIAQDILKFRISNLLYRLKVLISGNNDPYDTYSYIQEKHESAGVKSIFFFLLADFGEYDKGLPHSSKGLKRLIRSVQKKSEVGIHPGVGSHKRYNTILREKSRLESITSRQIKHSRQHYLLLRFRSTYRLLKATGIEHDYSMGYAQITGFRAGTSRPYLWFDLKKNQESSLTIHPFPAMDATMHKYMELSPGKAKEELHALATRIKAVGGDFITLWHNETLTDAGEWKGWREVFEYGLALGKQMES